MESFAQTTTDVLSLDEARTRMGNQGSTNSESFTKYASNLLAQKLRDVVDSLDFAENP